MTGAVTARCRWQLPAEARILPVVRAVVSEMAARRAGDDDLERIRLAVTEACANVVRHAYREGEGTLDLAICLGSNALIVEVRDTGVGIPDDPPPPSPRGGLGLPLIAELADELEIEPAFPGTCVTMTFALA